VKPVALSLSILSALALVRGPGAPPFVPRTLTPFDMAKAETLLRTRLPCLGCHELDGDGGRIGPSLSSLRGQRPADYVYRMISDPQHAIPGTRMPRVPMSDAMLDLVVSYLVQRAPAASPPSPLAASRPGAGPSDAASDGATRYGRLCAPCHGARGGGDGFNAPFLPVRPTVHADSAYMSTRTDDELFDTIFAGGYVMNRSNRMPPFGETLTREQIWGLVTYLRTLCRCAPPAWSRTE
jgi:mono/diheme cytochrome c family protein